jgi:Tol biopolymer transport system component
MLCVSALIYLPTKSEAQIGSPLGADHPELSWYQFETEHFVIIYHDGLDSIAQKIAPVAEEAYRVVTINLRTSLPGKTKIYVSDNDEIKNAFAFSDDHIFLWLRGILDDLPYSIRSSGTSKWLRTVITHEFTHIVLAHATKSWTEIFAGFDNVPRWFNEGMARFMEPDGWTDDLDMVLRVATVSGRLNFDLDDYLGGVLLYEGGQSLVRFIAQNYGDSSLATIIKHRGTIGLYDFDESVQFATKHSLHDIYEEWHKYLTVYYGTSYGQHDDTKDVGRKINSGLDIVETARLEPDGAEIAIIGKENAVTPQGIYVMKNDTSEAEQIFAQPGVEPYLSWSLDGRHLFFSKLRFGKHSDLEHDIYKLNIESGDIERLTTDGRYEYPESAHRTDQLVAVHYHQGGAELDLLSGRGEKIRSLTHFNDTHVQLYAPRWSPNDSTIACSIFRANGMRDIALITVATGQITYLTNDSINDRYPIWSPKGDTIVYVSHASGIPNLHRTSLAHVAPKAISDISSNIQAWDWPRSKDSLLVSSFDGKNRISLYWYPASHEVKPSVPAQPNTKYGAWRRARWPIVTRTEDSIPATQSGNVEGYNSLTHIAPLLVLPIVGSDASETGESGIRYGLTGAFTDPMGKHAIGLFVDYGDASNRIGYEVSYLNSQLGFGILGQYGDLLNFSGVIDNQSYYERSRRWSIGLTKAFSAPDDLSKLHILALGYAHRRLYPWNQTQFDSTPAALKPIQAVISQLTLTYFYTSRDFLTTLSATHADKLFKSDLTFTRYRFYCNLEFPLGGRSEFALVGRAIVQTGDLLPQEFVGFTSYDFFQGGFSFVGDRSSDRMRGIRRYYYGNRMAIFSPELREPDFLVSNLVPIVGAFHPMLVEFFDLGSVWYGDHPSNQPNVEVTPILKTHWLQSYGIELRGGEEGIFEISTGVGWELTSRAKPDVYLRVAAAL